MRQHLNRKGFARRTRRGATLVFVAFLAIGLVGMAALAIDISRMYGGVAELQTVADAAALRGAQHVQKYLGTNLSDSVNAFASSNSALGGSATLTITPAYWRDSDTTLVTTGVSFADSANAVQVVATRTAPLFFGGILRSVAGNPSRRAVAWLANVGAVSCTFKPVGLPIQNIFTGMGLGAINNRGLTQAEVDSLRSLLSTTAGKVQMTQIMYPKDGGITPTNETSIYWPLAGNMNDYADQISDGGGCDANASVTVGQTESPFSGGGGGAPAKKFVDGVLGSPPASGDALCTRIADDATCYDPSTGAAGITISASFTGGGTTEGCSGCGSLPIRMIAGFKLMCVFYGNPSNGQNNASERCPWLVNNFSAAYNKSYNAGSIVGYPVLEFTQLDGTVTLGNAPSLAQRLILVK